MSAAVNIAKQALSQEKSVIIGLQTTGEAGLMHKKAAGGIKEGEMTDYISAPSSTLERLIYKVSLYATIRC